MKIINTKYTTLNIEGGKIYHLKSYTPNYKNIALLAVYLAVGTLFVHTMIKGFI